MVYNIKWIIPKLRNPTKLWNIASSITFVAVGIFSKFIIELLNKTRVHNKHILIGALNRKGNTPLITVSNHHSCFDDPGLWGSLNLKHLLSRRRMRWSLAAQDICFTNVWYSYFFMLGKCIPVIRGEGVYQEAINFCLEKLASGDWVHVFPEGKVNMLKENMRLKWGVGRLIMESPITPLVIPIYHLGMDKVLPNDPPYIIKAGKKVTMYYGDPIDFSGMIADLRANNATEMEARKAITDRIQDELLRQSLRSCMQGFDNGVAVHAVTRSSQNLRRIMGSNTVHEVSVRNDRDIENLKAPDSNKRMVAYDKKKN